MGEKDGDCQGRAEEVKRDGSPGRQRYRRLGANTMKGVEITAILIICGLKLMAVLASE